MRVLIVQERIPSYRLPLFEALGQRPEISQLVVACSSRFTASIRPRFFTLAVFNDHRIGSFVLNSLPNFTYYDAVVLMFDLHWVSLIGRVFAHRQGSRPAIILWGIGESSRQGLRTRPLVDKLRFAAARRADTVLLYSKEIADLYRRNEFKDSQTAFLINSVKAHPSLESGPVAGREKFVALGTLDRRKGFDELIEAFRTAIPSLPPGITLEIGGDGKEEHSLRRLVLEYSLTDRVRFVGRVEGDASLRKLFEGAVACISPKQAGLSVLSSMSHGVPFITEANSVTGGERFLIHNGINGITYEGGHQQLAEEMIAVVQDRERHDRLVTASHGTYWKFASFDLMVDRFVEALKQALTLRSGGL